MSLQAIRAALDSRLAVLTPALPTAWENSGFTASAGVAWQSVMLLPARTVPAGIGRDAPALWRCVYQVMLCFPPGAGTGAAAARAGLTLTHFARGTALASGGVTVICEQAYVEPGRSGADWYRVAVAVPWFAYVG